MDFKTVKHGYDKKQVDDYIKKLVDDYEERLAKQKDRIFYLKDKVENSKTEDDKNLINALISSIEKAKLIENSSKNIYELETKRLVMIYDKMESILKTEGFTNPKAKENLLSFIKNCKQSLEVTLESHNQTIEQNSKEDSVKKLLAKMMGISYNPIQPSVSGAIDSANGEEIPLNMDIKLDKTINKKPAKNDFNNFLSSNTKFGNNFENIMFKNKSNFGYVSGSQKTNFDYSPNETGFDLKEAINPTEDLAEIMKAFDFYNDNKKDD